MSTTRRTFLMGALAAGGAVTLAGRARKARAAGASPSPGPAPKSLKILILGGTNFIGPHQVEYALARGHEVTLLNRNKKHPEMYRGQRVQLLVGDLGADVSALKGKTFDVVLDNPTTFPFWVRNAAQHLAEACQHYLFISTISVYSQDLAAGMNEAAPKNVLDPAVDPYTLVPEHAQRHYGALKARAEQEVEKHYPGRNTIVRPGLIVGPRDPSDRFTYWPVRIDRGGEVLAPGAPTDRVQLVDVRDLAEWTVRLAETRTLGTFHATGPTQPLTIAELLHGVKAVTTAGAQFTWVTEEFLDSQKVHAWSQLPVWAGSAALTRLDVSKAVSAGLSFRPLATTARDTLEWHRTRPDPERAEQAAALRAGITAAREAELLALWHKRPAK